MLELYPRLWRYALSLTRHRAEAEDLAHEAVVQALAKSDQFAPGTHVDRWMFRMLHRMWLNRLRAGKVRRGTGVIAVEDAGLATDQDAEQTFFGTQVLSAILALSDAQRSAVMMVYVEGFSYAEAAEMLDVPVGTIMSRLAAARAKLKDQLGDRE
ncbi:RNA polymerase sigma factor [Gymnodinialimonas sp. 2305UL16-5]|uniref:RNA polymerase sigma factor n=1 Tax=Gymnodinialimonas mytili TaxID=3126503 RepID=UPI0030AB2C48